MSSQRESDAAEAVQIAEQVLRRKLTPIEGCVALARLAHDLVPSWAEDPDFVVFGVISSETDHLPLPQVRHLWSASGLERADVQISRIEDESRSEVERACRNVIARFGKRAAGSGCDSLP